MILVILLTCWHASAFAQLEKLFINATMKDASNGAPIPGGTVTVLDSLDKDFTFMARANTAGELSAALYSGAHYSVFFEADGYAPRCAVIDLKGDRDWPDVSLVWKMTMPVELTPTDASTTRPDRCEWRCTFHPRTSKLTWNQQEATQRFTITVERNERSAEELEMDFKNTDNRYLLVKGMVKEYGSERAIVGASVKFSSPDRADSVAVTNARGEYEMKMPFTAVFRVTYSAPGRVSKIVEIDPRTVPEKVRKQGFVSWTDITLFEPVPGADLSFLEQPIGKAAYSPKSGTLEWDMDYSMPIMERLNALLGER